MRRIDSWLCAVGSCAAAFFGGVMFWMLQMDLGAGFMIAAWLFGMVAWMGAMYPRRTVRAEGEQVTR